MRSEPALDKKTAKNEWNRRKTLSISLGIFISLALSLALSIHLESMRNEESQSGENDDAVD